jgi:hypothetical protein
VRLFQQLGLGKGAIYEVCLLAYDYGTAVICRGRLPRVVFIGREDGVIL